MFQVSNIELIGLLAGMLTSIAFLPQVIKTWKSKSANDLSLVMFLVFFIGVALWLTYGLIINDLPMIFANVITLSFSGVILFFKLKYG